MKKLIVSRYNENIDWLNKINFDYVVYNKGINDLSQPHINLKNVGREADTYLNYIILNYLIRSILIKNLLIFQNQKFMHFLPIN